MMTRKTVLVVQDTSDLNFSKRHHTTGLGSIGTNQTGAKSLGLKLHSSLVLTTDGLPLGVLRSDCYAPEEKRKTGPSPTRRPIEDKQSFRWIEGYRESVEAARHMPQTHIVAVMDREADFYELYQEAAANRKRVGLLIRAKTDRKLVGRKRKLFAALKASPTRADLEVVIPRQRWKKAKSGKPEQQGLPGRPTALSVHFQEVTIPPTRNDLEGPITLNAVYAREKNPPRGAKSIEWMLLTTEPVATAEDAVRMVDLYTMRWRIEEWHRILKQGCIVQEHQNETAERLQRVIAIDVVLAWRIQLMTLLGREIPDLPCEVFFDEWEVKVLHALELEKGKRGKKPPFTLGVAILLLARQGGYMARKSDPPPGPKVIWRGMIKVFGMAAGYRLARIRGSP
jgi:hypothetical protein